MKQRPVNRVDDLPTTDVDSIVPNDASPGRPKNDEHHVLSLSSLVTSTNYRGMRGLLPIHRPLSSCGSLSILHSSSPTRSLLISSLFLVRNLAHLAQTMARGAQRVLELKNFHLSHPPWLANDAERGLVTKTQHTCCSISRTLNSCEPSFE